MFAAEDMQGSELSELFEGNQRDVKDFSGFLWDDELCSTQIE